MICLRSISYSNLCKIFLLDLFRSFLGCLFKVITSLRDWTKRRSLRYIVMTTHLRYQFARFVPSRRGLWIIEWSTNRHGHWPGVGNLFCINFIILFRCSFRFSYFNFFNVVHTGVWTCYISRSLHLVTAFAESDT